MDFEVKFILTCGKHGCECELVNLGCPAGALPSVHLTCRSPEGMLEKLQAARKHTQKNLRNALLWTLRESFTSITSLQALPAVLRFFPWWFLRVPYLCHTKALSCGHKPLKKTSIEGRQRLKVKNQSFQPFDLFIRNWFHTLLLLQKSNKNPLASGAHNLHISFTFSPGFVESAVWPHQEFRDRDGKKGAVLPRSSTGSCPPCSYQEDHQALVMTQFAQASKKWFASLSQQTDNNDGDDKWGEILTLNYSIYK